MSSRPCRRRFILCTLLATSGWSLASAADWLQAGGDPGMTKYCADDIPAGDLGLVYSKRFYPVFNGDPTVSGVDYWYGLNVVIRNGTAVVTADDRDNPQRAYGGDGVLYATTFRWDVGTTLGNFPQFLGLDQAPNEIGWVHFATPTVWNPDDGLIYQERGGDQTAIVANDPIAGPVYGIPLNGSPNGYSGGGDAAGFLAVYGQHVLYRFGDTRDSEPYGSYTLSPDSLGDWENDLTSPTNNPYGSSDVPKVAQNVAVVASLFTDPDSPSSWSVAVDGTDLATGNHWENDYEATFDRPTGFYCGIPEYWHFVASEDDGVYAFFTRQRDADHATVVRVLDLHTGNEMWSYPLNQWGETPLLACHGGALYVIGRSQQLKLSLADGSILWQQGYSFPNDGGYTAHVSWDRLYRPMVLTDSTLWFVDGDSAHGNGRLIGMSTLDGSLVTSLDLPSLYSGSEHFLAVNDLVATNGTLGLLVSVASDDEPYGGETTWYSTGSRIFYQDLLVWSTGGPTGVAAAPTAHPRIVHPIAAADPASPLGQIVARGE